VAYDEDDGGFQFSRKDTKKSKPSAEQQTFRSSVTASAQPSPRKGRPPKTTIHKDPENTKRTEPIPVNGVLSTKLPLGHPRITPTEFGDDSEQSSPNIGRQEARQPAPTEKPRGRGRPGKSKEVQRNGLASPEPTTTAKIALPFADTPVIRRNKEMREKGARKGQRRSSLGMRGRRASSLIESGASNGEIIPPTLRIPERNLISDLTFCFSYSASSQRGPNGRFLQTYCQRRTFGTTTDETVADMVCNSCDWRKAVRIENRR
jgi:kinetochore protein Mis13/DSN1